MLLPDKVCCNDTPRSPLVDGPAPKEVDCSVASKFPTTLKVSPKLSNDWLNKLNDGAISIDPFGLRDGYYHEEKEGWQKTSVRHACVIEEKAALSDILGA